MKFSRELVGSTTAILLLSVLSKGAAHGYEIIRRIEDESNGMFKWKEGTLYPALHKLEKQRLIDGEWQVTENGRRRRVYCITPKGEKALLNESRDWRLYVNALDQMLGENHA